MTQQLLHTHYTAQPIVLQPGGPTMYAAPYVGRQVLHIVQVPNQHPGATSTVLQRQYSPQAAKGAVVLGAIQVVTGLLSIIFQTICMKLEHSNPKPRTREYLGPGVWCGALFLLTGAVGILAGKRNTYGLITSYMTFNIFSALFSWSQLGFAAASLAAVNNCKEFGILNLEEFRALHYYSDRAYCDSDVYITWIALDALLMILANLAFITSVTAAASCCKATCGCCRSTPGYVVRQPGTTVYVPAATMVQQPTSTVSMGYAGQPYHVQGTTAGYPQPAVGGMMAPPQYPAHFTASAAAGAPPYQPIFPSAPPAMLSVKDEPPTYDDAIGQ